MQTPCHGPVGDALLLEQAYLCCYCESEAKSDNSHIEHLIPRSMKPQLTYDYHNLAISCNGGTDNNQHCGSKKGGDYDPTCFSSPHDPATVLFLRYFPDGQVDPSRGLDEFRHKKAEYLIGLLNLKCPRLVERRHSHAARLINTLGETPTPEMLEWAEDYYLRTDVNGKLREFNSVSRMVLCR